ERCSIRLENGEPRFVGASGVAQRLIPLTEDTDLIEDERFAPEKQVRVRFVADASGTITSLQLLVDDGRVLTRKRIRSAWSRRAHPRKTALVSLAKRSR